jgi:hypothetical protein
MRERVAYHQGWIDIRSRPGDGVRITLGIPIAGDDVAAEPEHLASRTGSR